MIPCPCCKQPVDAQPLDVVVDRHKMLPMEASILGAIWRGNGLPVKTERIFDAMYADDPDGGPRPSAMYDALKAGLCRLRALETSGVSIEPVGYRLGYRLSLRSNYAARS